MRLYEIDSFTDLNSVLAFIQTNCKQYLQAHPKCFDEPMMRGISAKYSTPTILDVNQNRELIATPKQINDVFIKAFNDAGFKANRNNSIFASGSDHQVSMYVNSDDEKYAVFPIGEFDITWSDKISDLYMDLEFMFEENVIKFDPDTHFYMDDYFERKISENFKINKNEDALKRFSQLAVTGKPVTLNMIFNLTDNPEETEKMFYKYCSYESMILNLNKQKVPVIDVSLVPFLKQNYHTNDFERALNSGFEIMVHCEKYLAVPIKQLKALNEII